MTLKVKPFYPGEETLALPRLEDCLTDVCQWKATNYLQLNDSKTEFIVFGSKKNLSELPSMNLIVGHSTIECSTVVKNIGAYLDCNMNLARQLSSTCKSAWFHLHQISKIRRYLTTEQAKSVIHAYVTSRLDQNNSLLIGLPKNHIKCLQNVQNASAKLIMGGKKHDHVTPILRDLHWLPIESRIIFKILLLTFKVLNGKGPVYLKDILRYYKPTRNLRSASSGALCVPKTHYVETSKRAFYARAPTEWNNLPKHIRDSDSVTSFKSRLKTYLFKQKFH